MVARVLLVVLCCLWALPLNAQGKRVALVIGNSAYQNTTALTNPKNDADDVATALQAIGFDVTKGLDLDKAGMDRTIRAFAGKLNGADVGLFFYAGHGLQVGGVNYLVPIDAQLTTASSLDFEMTRLDLVQRTMENETKTNVIMLDACRDNPLSRNLARALGTRSASIGRGLAQAEAGVGTLISYSTQPGNVALDGTGRNSPYAGSLVRHVKTAGEDLTSILIRVRNDVIDATASRQVPWDQHALRERLYLSGRPQQAQPPVGDAAQAWAATQNSTSIAVLEAFERQFQDTAFASMALARIEELRRQQTAILVDPSRKTTPSTEPPKGSFVGAWRLERSSPACKTPSLTVVLSISAAGRIVSSSSLGRGSGSVSSSGGFNFVVTMPDGGTGKYSGKIEGNKGRGDYVGTAPGAQDCRGSFSLSKV